MATLRRIKLIANPVAGTDAGRRIARAEAWFRARDVAVDLTLTGA